MLLATIALAAEPALPTGPLLCPQALDAGWMEVEGAVIPPAEPLDYDFDRSALDQMTGLVRAVMDKGVRVAVVLVPERAHALQGPRAGAVVPEAWAKEEAVYAGLLRHFREMGALAPDVAAVATELREAGGQFFRPDDGHWSQEGARAAAVALAGQLRADGDLPGLGTHDQGLVERRGRKHVAGAYVKRIKALCGTTLPDYRGPAYTLEAAPVGSESLLADVPPPPVVVVGSSFARDPFGFGPALAAELDSDVLAIGIPGGRVRSGMQAWLATADLDNAPPAVLVWVLTLHHLLAPAEPSQPTLHGATGLRVLRPMVDGGCDAAHEVARLDSTNPSQLLAPGASPVPAAGHYLQLDGGEVVHRVLKVSLGYVDGANETLLVAPDGRVRGQSYVALQFDPLSRSAVSSIAVATRGGTSLGEFTARACRLDKP